MSNHTAKIFIFLAALFFNSLAAICFFGLTSGAILFALPFVPLLAQAFLRMRRRREQRLARKALMNFLQYLCSQLAGGQSLRSALKNSGRLGFGAGSKHKEKLLYARLAAGIAAQQSSEELLGLLIEAFPCPEAEGLLFALRMEDRLGDRLLSHLRDACDTARELVLLEEEMLAQSARARTEGLILSLIPFVLAPIFHNIVHLPDGLSSAALNNSLRVLAYFFAASALSLHFFLMASNATSAKVRKLPKNFQKKLLDERQKNFPQPPETHFKSYHYKLVLRYRLIYPEYFYSLDDEQASALYKVHGRQALRRVLLCFFLSLPLFIFTSIPLYCLPLPPAFALLLSEAQFVSKAEAAEKALRQDLPLLLALLAQLLKNGLSLNNALTQCAPLFKNQNSGLSVILALIAQRLRQADPASVLLEKLAVSLKLSDASSALLMLSRFVQLGGKELLLLLEKQLGLCWAEQRQGLRRTLDARGGLLLLPMLMDLLAVMLIGAAPALGVFSAF